MKMNSWLEKSRKSISSNPFSLFNMMMMLWSVQWTSYGISMGWFSLEIKRNWRQYYYLRSCSWGKQVVRYTTKYCRCSVSTAHWRARLTWIYIHFVFRIKSLNQIFENNINICWLISSEIFFKCKTTCWKPCNGNWSLQAVFLAYTV